MTNIFSRAKFGDKFKTREGWYAVYDGQTYFGPCGKGHLVHELRYRGKDNKYCITVLRCENDGSLAGEKGKHAYDIVGKWQEEIDEKKLNGLARAEVNVMNVESSGIGVPNDHFSSWVIDFAEEAFKAGYRKALEK